MKKFVTAVTAVSLSALLLAGCGQKDAQESTTAESTAVTETESAAETESEEKVYPDEAYLDNLNVGDYVELGEYKGLEVTAERVNVTDEMVDEYIQNMLENNKEKVEVDRPAQDGDVVNIKYVGKKDGETFDGGSSDSYDLTLGSNTFIDGFEEGIVGMKKNEIKDLNLTFPEDYSNEELAGQAVVFTVTVNAIYEETVPELNDEFVADRGIEGVSTVDEYRDYVYNNLLESAQRTHDSEVETKVLAAALENTTVKQDPEAMVERYYDRLVNNLTYAASMYGVDLATFMQYSYGMDEEQYEEELQNSARQATEQVLMLQAIAEKEGLTVSDEEMEADLETKATDYGYDSLDAYKEALGSELKGYREYVMTEKVTEYLRENAVVTDVDAEETETAGTEAAETETAEETAGETETAAGASAENTETESETE
ncbi:MAG: trigger factor [Eubacteriales bacterium]|nr:trigger factor [Eubacteriales bacterium]